jgi:hypothetical protein
MAAISSRVPSTISIILSLPLKFLVMPASVFHFRQ